MKESRSNTRTNNMLTLVTNNDYETTCSQFYEVLIDILVVLLGFENRI